MATGKSNFRFIYLEVDLALVKIHRTHNHTDYLTKVICKPAFSTQQAMVNRIKIVVVLWQGRDMYQAFYMNTRQLNKQSKGGNTGYNAFISATDMILHKLTL